MSPDSAVTPGEASLHATSSAVSLTVNDIDRSLAWYTDLVGFTIAQRHERDGKLMAVSLKAGTVRLLIARDDGAKGMDRVKGVGLSMMIETPQNIDELAQRIKDAGGTLASEPETAPWGPRVFRLRDPDGFMLVISSER